MKNEEAEFEKEKHHMKIKVGHAEQVNKYLLIKGRNSLEQPSRNFKNEIGKIKRNSLPKFDSYVYETTKKKFTNNNISAIDQAK